MAGKKKGGKESNIIPFQKNRNETPKEEIFDFSDWMFDDEDEYDDYADEMSEEAAQQIMSALFSGMLNGGMTNEQYKGMLLDSLQPWKEVLKLAQEGDNLRIVQKAKDQISLINKKLRY